MSTQPESKEMPQYISVNQAAKLCNVTRFTIRNWADQKKIQVSRTAGGHRRVLKSDLLRMIEESGLGNYAAETAPSLHCWEYARLKRSKGHDCEKCLVYKNKLNKCFLAVHRFGGDGKHCSGDCATCPYLLTYFPDEVKNVKKLQDGISCWEYARLKGSAGHDCEKCLVFKNKLNRCFLAVQRFGKDGKHCSENCATCAYLKDYFPEEVNDVKKLSDADTCWEHMQAKGTIGHECKRCLVFKQKLNKCFLAVREFDQNRKRCPSDCASCSYIEEHFPGELKWLKKTAGSSAKASNVKSIPEGSKTTAPPLFKVGAYASKLKNLLGSKKAGKKAT